MYIVLRAILYLCTLPYTFLWYVCIKYTQTHTHTILLRKVMFFFFIFCVYVDFNVFCLVYAFCCICPQVTGALEPNKIKKKWTHEQFNKLILKSFLEIILIFPSLLYQVIRLQVEHQQTFLQKDWFYKSRTNRSSLVC